MGRFIVFEGADSMGKTGQVKRLANEIDAVYYRAPVEAYLRIHPIPELLTSCAVSVARRFRYSIDGMLWAGRDVQRILDTGQDVVADRWIWTTLAYHFVWLPELHLWDRDEIAGLISMVDTAILVDIPHRPLWERRINARAIQKGTEVYSGMQLDELWRIHAKYFEINPNFNVIDNSGSRDNSFLQVKEAIKTRQRAPWLVSSTQ